MFSSSAEGFDAALNIGPSLDVSEYEYSLVTYMTPNKSDDKNSEAASQSALGNGANFVPYSLNTDGYYHKEQLNSRNLPRGTERASLSCSSRRQTKTIGYSLIQ